MNFLGTGPALTHLCALNVWHVIDVKYLLNDKERSSIAGTRWGGWLWWRRLRASLLPPTLLSLLIFLKKGTEWVRQLPLMDTDQVTQVIKNQKSRQA